MSVCVVFRCLCVVVSGLMLVSAFVWWCDGVFCCVSCTIMLVLCVCVLVIRFRFVFTLFCICLVHVFVHSLSMTYFVTISSIVSCDVFFFCLSSSFAFFDVCVNFLSVVFLCLVCVCGGRLFVTCFVIFCVSFKVGVCQFTDLPENIWTCACAADRDFESGVSRFARFTFATGVSRHFLLFLVFRVFFRVRFFS